MIVRFLVVLSLVLGASTISVFGQAPKKTPAPAVKTAQTPLSKIMQMVQMKLPEAAVLNAIQKAGPMEVSADDFLKLKQLGASDKVIVALSGGTAADPTPAASNSAPATRPVPPAGPPPVGGGWNTELASLACERPTNSAKRVLAIDEFDFGTVKSNVAAIFGTQVDLGKGILALMTKRLAEENKYRIVERKRLGQVMAEQDLGASNRVKQGTNAKIGRIQGADAILMGTIVVFGNDSRTRNVNAGALGGRFGGYLGSANVKVGSDKAVVVISYRLVDAESSEVIATGEARGESSRRSTGVGLAGYGAGIGGAGGVDMTARNFQETVIGEATVDCINQLAAIANSKEQRVAMRNTDVEARIAEIAGNKIYLAAGSNEGVQKCDRFEISRVIKEIKDPSTGEVLDLQTERVGELLVTEVRDKISIAYYNGSAEPKVGYVAKKIQ
jgi:curli biogenesis system outer membrane secretion channel CsgG